MPVIISTGHAQVQFVWSTPNFITGGAATTMGFNVAEEDNLLDVLPAVQQSWEDNLRGRQDDSILLTELTLVTAELRIVEPVGLEGGTAGQLSSPNTSVLVSARTARRGRRGRGRNFWPGFAYESEVGEDGTLSPAYYADLSADFQDFYTQLRDINLFMAVLQGDNEDDKTPPINPPPLVTSYQLANRVASQRRRNRR